MKPSEFIDLALKASLERNTEFPKVKQYLESGEDPPNWGTYVVLLTEEVVHLSTVMSLMGKLLDEVIEEIPDSFGDLPGGNGVAE